MTVPLMSNPQENSEQTFKIDWDKHKHDLEEIKRFEFCEKELSFNDTCSDRVFEEGT